MNMSVESSQVVVLGAGPGGYAAAFRLADLGQEVILIEREPTLGGVCLNVGCIPSKTLLHLAEICHELPDLAEHGVEVGPLRVHAEKVVAFKDKVIKQLTAGLNHLAKSRKVKVLHGEATFTGPNSLRMRAKEADTEVRFTSCIVATGSRPVELPFMPVDDRVLDSTSALELKRLDGRLLIIGGGIIGCEMATIYQALGAEVTIVEMTDQIMPGAEKALVQPCQKIMASRGVAFRLGSRVSRVEAQNDGLWVWFDEVDEPEKFEQILVAVGRAPNGHLLGLDKAGVAVTEQGFVEVDAQMRSNVKHIYAIGDIASQPMLAHKATAEGRLVAEVIAGKRVRFDARCIPSVAYTDPEVAWVGQTKSELEAAGIAYKEGVFPWAANGRSLCVGRSEGKTMIWADEQSGRVLGGAIVGRGAGDLIALIGFAVEMAADIEDIEGTIFPHPTFVETIGLAAEVLSGTVTDL